MSRTFLLFFFSLFLGTLYASPVGNGAFPEIIQEGFFIPCSSWVDARVGYEGDFVGDEKMKQTNEGSGRVDTFQQYTNAATITLNVLDRLDIFGVFGSSRVCANWRYDFNNTVTRIQLETLYRFLWGVGAKGVLYDWGKLFLSTGGRYSSCRYKASSLTSNGADVSASGGRINWSEWQVHLDLSYKIDFLIPYIGVQYANARADLGTFSTPIAGNGSGKDHFESRTPVGMVVGCALSSGRYFMLNVEGRLINEEALTISGDLRF